jgi:branched-chain amino acid transport system substrate-binding protein
MNVPVRILLATLTSIVLGTSAVGAEPASGPPVEVNAILSTTGAAAFIGNIEAKALQVLEAETNANGGIHGRPLHFSVLDDESNPQIDVQHANALAAKGVALFLGPNTPAGCFATSPIVEKTGPLSFCLNPFGHPTPGSYQFAPFPDSFQVAAANVRFFRERGLTRIAMINATDGSGRDSDLAFAAAFKLPENRSVTLVAQEHYGAGDVSVAAQLARIKAANPQAIVSYNTGAPFGTVLRGLFDAGMSLPVATSGGNANLRQVAEYAKFMPSELDFGAIISFAPGDADVPAVREQQVKMIDILKRAGLRPEAGFAAVWDAAALSINILQHVPLNPSREAAFAYLSKLQGWTGIDGVYNFNRYQQRGVGMDSVLMVRWDAATNSLVPASRGGGGKL